MSERRHVGMRGSDWSLDFLLVTIAVISIVLVVLINLFLWFFSR